MNTSLFRVSRLSLIRGIIGFVVALASLMLIDPIPLNNGLGWDGKIFFGAIQAWSEGGYLGDASKPYYFMRMGAFVPAVAFNYIFHSNHGTYIFFRILQVFFMFLSTQLLLSAGFSIVNGKELKSEVSVILFVLCFAFCHAVFTMPSLYPFLTDHTSILLSSISLYAWNTIRNDNVRNTILFLLAAFGFFVMPMVSLVPMVFLVLPLKDNRLPIGNTLFTRIVDSKKFFFVSIVASITLAFFTARYLFRFSRRLSEELLLSCVGGSSPAIIELRSVSAACFALIALIFSFMLIYGSLRSIKLIQWSGVLVALAAIVVAMPVLYFFPDWRSGMEGPKFILYITMQGLRAPGTSIVALFSYYGPIGLLGIAALFIGVLGDGIAFRKYRALFVIGSIFGGFSLLGNETRQFVCVLPVFVFLAMITFKKHLAMAAISLTFTILLLPIGYPISDHLAEAISNQSNFMHPSWQAYFGRQGPWMSTPSILLFGSMAFFYTILVGMYFMFLNRIDSQNISESHE